MEKFTAFWLTPAMQAAGYGLTPNTVKSHESKNLSLAARSLLVMIDPFELPPQTLKHFSVETLISIHRESYHEMKTDDLTFEELVANIDSYETDQLDVHTYDKELPPGIRLRMGLLDPRNYKLLSEVDFEMFRDAHGVYSEQSKEKILTDILRIQLAVIQDLSIQHPNFPYKIGKKNYLEVLIDRLKEDIQKMESWF